MRNSRIVLGALVLLIGLFATGFGSPTLGQAPIRDWRPVPFDQLFGQGSFGSCLDGAQPNVFLLSGTWGTIAYNWVSGRRTPVSPHFASLCGSNGTLFFQPVDSNGSPIPDAIVRFSSRDPQDRPVAHIPTHSTATSRWVYDLEPASSTRPAPHRLWASPDYGLTWQLRSLPFPGDLAYLSLASEDGQALYAAVDGTTASPADFGIWFSADAGLTWESRSSVAVDRQWGQPLLRVDVVPGTYTPIEYMSLVIGYHNLNRDRTLITREFSADGARTFQTIAQFPPNIPGGEAVDIWYTPQGLVRVQHRPPGNPEQPVDLTRSTDNGASWQPLPAPPEQPFVIWNVVGNGILVASGNPGLWYSLDTGNTWQPLADEGGFFAFTPYSPFQIFRGTRRLVNGVYSTSFSVTAFPEADRSQPLRAAPSHAPGSRYFAATGHNVPAVFLRYWDAQGGLAQFGNPLTEAFREVSPTDGQVYLTQYFERARFEHHPELGGTAHEIELGRLGAEQTANRRAAAEGPFRASVDPHKADTLYFGPTGHTLSGAFRAYWETRGGLARFGYPLSEEFSEISPTDGQRYQVQYFERARFEYHPELPAPYRVSLGLLGVWTLHARGWLP